MKKIKLSNNLKDILEVVEKTNIIVVASGLSKYREKNGIKATFFAKRLGVSTSFLCAIEKGRKSVPYHLIEKIELALQK
jgi:DNA-binding transcriptional regulator YiaG